MCDNLAIATLTYVYADMTAVLGPLATFAEPHCYDLCENHSRRLVPPRGWELVKLETDEASLRPSSDDLDALAEAVREAAGASSPNHPVHATGRRGHLRIVRDSD
ncbi:MAG: hypothetical protein RL441_1087 [Actinomycetota bacterium]|jgi:hypothetical protein